MSTTAPEPLVSVVTANLDGAEHLGPFLDSLRQQTFPADRLEVVVVDNGSADGSLALVQARWPRARIIRNGSNLGFARANNQGAEIARGRYLALLNNDTRLKPDWVETMLAAIEAASADTVCIASRMLSWDGSAVDFIGGTMRFNGIGEHLHMGAPADSEAGRRFPAEVLFASGAAMLVDRAVFLDAGGFDEDYFAYYEDVDLGWRLWLLGYRIAFCPEAVVYHRRNVNRPGGARTTFLLERNALFTVIKNYDDVSLARLLPGALLSAARRAQARSGLPRGTFEGFPQVGEQGRSRTASVAARAVTVARRLRSGQRDASSPSGALATVAALDAVATALPSVVQKRARLQARRRRSDSEIARLFGAPFGPDHWPGRDEEVATLRALGVVDYLESLLADVDVSGRAEALGSTASS